MSKKINVESTASVPVAAVESVHSDVFDEYQRRIDERCILHEKQIADIIVAGETEKSVEMLRLHCPEPTEREIIDGKPVWQNHIK